MAKKTTEKDVLIVRDEKTGEISVVAGLNADGSPKRTPAKAENAQSFLQFDRHGLKDPEGNKEMLAPHKVDTSGYEKKVQEEQSAE